MAAAIADAMGGLRDGPAASDRQVPYESFIFALEAVTHP